MTKLPVVSGKQVIKALRKIGFVVMRQRGSHVLLRRVSAGRIIKLTVPLHKELKRVRLKEYWILLKYLLRSLWTC